MSRTDEDMVDEYKFIEAEHKGGQHDTYQPNCYECYREDRLVQAHKVVNSHDDMLNKHPALAKLDQHLHRE